MSLSCGRIDDFLIYLQIFHTNDLNQHAQYHEHLITLLDRSPRDEVQTGQTVGSVLVLAEPRGVELA